jgi:hypothetical protein
MVGGAKYINRMGYVPGMIDMRKGVRGDRRGECELKGCQRKKGRCRGKSPLNKMMKCLKVEEFDRGIKRVPNR